VAALLGGVPLMLGTGTGSEIRQPLGYSIVGGLMLSQLLTLYTTPVVYLYLDRLATTLHCIACAGRAAAWMKRRQSTALQNEYPLDRQLCVCWISGCPRWLCSLTSSHSHAGFATGTA
jgi:hypothetical protein